MRKILGFSQIESPPEEIIVSATSSIHRKIYDRELESNKIRYESARTSNDIEAFAHSTEEIIRGLNTTVDFLVNRESNAHAIKLMLYAALARDVLYLAG